MSAQLYGRHAEVGEVESRLADRRLVTLVGPGGIGKTVLAAVVAERVAPTFPMGAVHIDLTRVDQPDGVFEAVAGQLGYADFASLLDSPGDQPALLVIDNCEHVLDAAADVIDLMLTACRMPSVLATSRAPLDLPDESVVSVGALPVPGIDVADPDVASVRLLLDRARHHGLELGDGDLPLVAEICRRLDGVPLAIELAAARLRVVGLPELVAELEAAPHALARRRSRGQASHRGVAELVNWSYELLRPAEQIEFVRLGVFAGPFDRDIARALADAPARWDDAFDALVASSLVVVDRHVDATRYRLLHPVRAVALDRLEHSGGADELRSLLVDAVIGRLLETIRAGPTGWRPDLLHDLIGMYDNAAASVRWALDHDDSPDRALTLVAAMWGIVHNAHSGEIHRLGEAVLERWPDRAAPRWANAAATVATCRFLAGDVDGAIELAEQALPHAERSRTAPALLHRVMAQSRRAAGDLEAACALFRRGADVAAERGARGLAMELGVDHGLALVEAGELAAGIDLIEAILDQADRDGAPINRSWARASRASALWQRDGASALPAIDEALAEARALGYPAGITFALRLRAAASLVAGDDETAATSLLELIDQLLQRGGLDEMRVVLDLAAELMRRHGIGGWEDVAATAETLPITSFLTPTALALLPAERPAGRALPTREIYLIVRRSLRQVVEASSREIEDEAGSAPAEPDSEWVSEGDVWRVTYRGTTVRVKSSKGANDLARLLAAPGREISALDLAGSPASSGTAEDELVDGEARRRYEDRVRDVHAEIEAADADHDLARAELLRAELDAIVDELTSAFGLGGRSRRTAGPAERARSAVTQRIRSTIKRIGTLHPALASHLRQSVSTGVFCSYAPVDGTRWRVRR